MWQVSVPDGTPLLPPDWQTRSPLYLSKPRLVAVCVLACDESPNLSDSLSQEPPKPLSQPSPSKRNLLGRLAAAPPGNRHSSVSLLEGLSDPNAWVDIPGASNPSNGSYGSLPLEGGHRSPTTLAELAIDEDIRRRATVLVQQHVVTEAEAVDICKANPGLSDYHTSLQLTWLETRHQVAGTIFRSVRWWADPNELLELLEQALQVPASPPTCLLLDRFATWSRDARRAWRRAVCHALKYWARLAVEDLNAPGCQPKLQRILSQIEQSQLLGSNELTALHAAVFNPVGHVTPRLRNEALPPTTTTLTLLTDLNSHQAANIAQQLTILDWDLTAGINVDQLRQEVKSDHSSSSQLQAAIKHGNRIRLWGVESILAAPTPSSRAEVMVRLLKVCEQLQLLGNYNTLLSLFGALNHAAVGRLKKTFASLSKSANKLRASLDDLLTPADNHENYRKALLQAQNNGEPAMPYLGLYLKDLMAVHNSYKTSDPDAPDADTAGVNLAKLLVLNKLLLSFTDAHLHVPAVVPDLDTLASLRKALEIEPASEANLYDRSLALEARDGSSSTLSVPGSPALHDTSGKSSDHRPRSWSRTRLFKRHNKKASTPIRHETVEQATFEEETQRAERGLAHLASLPGLDDARDALQLVLTQLAEQMLRLGSDPNDLESGHPDADYHLYSRLKARVEELPQWSQLDKLRTSDNLSDALSQLLYKWVILAGCKQLSLHPGTGDSDSQHSSPMPSFQHRLRSDHTSDGASPTLQRRSRTSASINLGDFNSSPADRLASTTSYKSLQDLDTLRMYRKPSVVSSRSVFSQVSTEQHLSPLLLRATCLPTLGFSIEWLLANADTATLETGQSISPSDEQELPCLLNVGFCHLSATNNPAETASFGSSAVVMIPQGYQLTAMQPTKLWFWVAKGLQSPSSASLPILLDSPAPSNPAITTSSQPVAPPKPKPGPPPAAPKPKSQPNTRVVLSQPQHDDLISSPRRHQIATAARQNLARPPGYRRSSVASLPPAALHQASQRMSDGSDFSDLLVLNLPDDDNSDVMTSSKPESIRLAAPERVLLEAREESSIDPALEPCSDV
eukprot:m.161402 g.161402  ORF g.161402 m.161402 type:complete len:1078 (-) comp16529_c0_seq1:29-3262(-)